ncbi:MAG TPA: serine/threonine-protein kinase [Kofleriaceae bacterium]|jgi:tetratricopeptide (TPR) repeat protein|nr:serine/threonine-protein kinase [Kofleriaceae bacterium]
MRQELAPGTIVDRFRVIRRLGTGSMGWIYAAHDPALDRNVALKLLRSDRLAADQRDAMADHPLREARAMAQLAHPNVVTVHELGRFGDQIFIAMELVDGQTLGAWLAEAPRGWREIVATFRAAGEGLAAAHAAGLVHRDVKPDNLLVGRDGRVRVTDFGLVRIARTPLPAAADARASGVHHTSNGIVVGTPYYMAPEQYRSEPADPRSDQFSFCVALHEALYGEHPFVGAEAADLVELPQRILAGELRSLPAGRRIPAWLGAVVRRGLSVDPAQRFPSMTALLAALSPGPAARRWRRGALVAAVVAAALIIPFADVAVEAGDACDDARAAITGLWNPVTRAEVQLAFAATGKPFAAAAFTEVHVILDRYVASLSDLGAETCVATRGRSVGDDLLARRTMCVESRTISVRTTLESFATADAAVVEHAAAAVHALPELSSCADPQALLGPAPPPSDPAARLRIRELRTELAQAQNLHDAGRYQLAFDRTTPLVDRARAEHYRPLEAEVLFLRGQIAERRADAATAEAALQQAVLAADAGRSDELAARILLRLIQLRTGRGPKGFDDAQPLIARVTALIERVGGSLELDGLLHVATGRLLFAAGRYDDAEREATRGLDLLERRFGPTDDRVADALAPLARIASLRVQPELAAERAQRVLAIRTATLGADHPEVATATLAVGDALTQLTRYGDAQRAFDTALSIRQRALGPDHPDVGDVFTLMAHNDSWQLHYDAALAHSRQAVAIAERAYGRHHVTYGRKLCDEARVLLLLERPRDTVPLAQEGRDVLIATLGPDQLSTAHCRRSLADALHRLGRDDEARPEAAASLAVQEHLTGPGNPYNCETWRILGEIDLGLGHPAQAVADFERARTLAETLDPGVRAGLAFDLARALGAAHQDAPRIRTLVDAARAAAAGDPRLHDNVRDFEAWLAHHPSAAGFVAAATHRNE